MEWQKIARHVGTRTYNEIKLHAHKYFIKLQQATRARQASGMVDDELPADINDGNWTFTEDLIFENGLARYDETTSNRWEVISKLIPGKTGEDVRKRYQKLLYDIARIESGEEVVLHYKSSLTSDAAVAAPVVSSKDDHASAEVTDVIARPDASADLKVTQRSPTNKPTTNNITGQEQEQEQGQQ